MEQIKSIMWFKRLEIKDLEYLEQNPDSLELKHVLYISPFHQLVSWGLVLQIYTLSI